MRSFDRDTSTRLLVGVAVVTAAWALVVWITGGFTLAVGPLTLSSRSAWRPSILAVMSAAAAAGLTHLRWRAALARAVRDMSAGAMPAIVYARRFVPSSTAAAVALAVAVGAIGWHYGSKTASGPDSFAYVSQAALWRTGRLDIPIPLAGRVPWPNGPDTFAPFGYRPSTDGRALVPITAPGFPIAMAALQMVGGHSAAFVVTPAAGALLVWLTFLIGRRLHSGIAGVGASWLVATSPAFLFMLMWPMSDIAAAVCSAAIIVFLLRSDVTGAFLAGLAASAGILTRPNFALVAAAAGGWLVLQVMVGVPDRRRAFRRAAAFAVALVPGLTATLWLNVRWFGSGLASGYGTASELLAWERVPLNVSRYAAWLTETSPLAWIGLVALALPVTLFWGRTATWPERTLLAAVTAATISLYLIYQPFTDWWYLRFLLPAWPAIWVGTVVVLVHVLSRWRATALLGGLVVFAAGIAGSELARARGVFALGEERYVSVARLVAGSTEPAAVILTWQHSGTVRYYAGRETIRFDLLDPAWLDRSIQWLQARGRHPYVLVEDWELPLFRERFASANTLGALDFRPAATWESTRVSGRVFLYDPIDGERHGTADPGAILDRVDPRGAFSSFPRLAFETAGR